MSASVTWLGHATALIDIDGDRLLIDPLGRGRTKGIEGLLAVLVTHSHVDHLNRWTLKILDKEPPLYVPHGASGVVKDLGFSDVHEVEPGDHLSIGKLNITVVPTKHDNGRWKKGDRPLCVGFVIEKNGIVVHHAGDIDFSDFALFDEIGSRHNIGTTLLPIGGMLPVWYYRARRNTLDKGVHIDPDAAVDVAKRLQAGSMIPVHWGTVNLRLGPPSAPRRRLEKIASDRGLSDLVCMLGHGHSAVLKAPTS